MTRRKEPVIPAEYSINFWPAATLRRRWNKADYWIR